ncbi:helix-turn-helix domain-containing protein [Paenibacillus sp. P26]|nr:helix-turn-helix domain-containing protein [Paenibacillus sp. P26]UUZ89650.1 helix-turn-helix domain-containing protein [Paenibacillus sp. P25]
MPAGSTRRRTPGLRREEVASLSGISLPWYTALEQGRDIQVSEQVLESLARTLRLSPDESRYLQALAHPPSLRSGASGKALRFLPLFKRFSTGWEPIRLT